MKKSYKDLQVWRKAIDLANRVYRATEAFPVREHYGLSAQIRKSAVSIPSNIAEGSARYGDKEFTQFLMIARGSLAELHTQLILAENAGYLKKEIFDALENTIDEIGRMINGLKASLQKPEYGKPTTND